MTTREIRCASTLHGKLVDNRYLEVKCKRRACGHRPGLVVLHTIDIRIGEVTKTRQFSDPNQQKTQKE